MNIDNIVDIYDITADKKIATIILPSTINAIALSPDGKYLAIGSADGLIRIWGVPAK